MPSARPFLLALAVVVAGCTPAAVTTDAPTALAESTDVVAASTAGSAANGEIADELIEPGVLVVCTDFPVPRFAEFDAAGEPTGASVEMAVELARRIGLEIEHRNTVFEEILPDIEAGDCDLGLAGHIITPEREERITMVPYLRGRQQLIVRTGNPDGFDELTDLCGEEVLTRAGSLQEELVHGTGPYEGEGLNDQCAAAGEPELELTTYPGEAEAVEAFVDGEGAAFLGSTLWVSEHPADLELARAVTLPDYTTGIGINREDVRLADAIRDAMDDLIADGTYHAILDEWGVGQPLE